MTKNVKSVTQCAIAVVALLVLAVVGRDIYLRTQRTHDCGDGPRPTIDIRDFTTRYSAYSLELEASIADKARISTKLTPNIVQQLSEATQNARDLRQYIVAGYNSCAVTKAQYAQSENRFQALDSLAREINELTGKPSLSPQEATTVNRLIKQYGELARKASSE